MCPKLSTSSGEPVLSRTPLPRCLHAVSRMVCTMVLLLPIDPVLGAAAATTPGDTTPVGTAATTRKPGSVDASRLAAADSEPQNWYTGGRDQDGSYYSPLTTINASNVKTLGFAWQYDLGSPLRGQEATPVIVDGILYTSGTWGYVYAVDAASGREVWRYDPKSDYFAGRNP